MSGNKPQDPHDPRRVLRPGSDPDTREMPVAQRVLDLAIRLKDLLRLGSRGPLDAYAVPRPTADAVPSAWRGGAFSTTISHSGQRLTPDVALFHDGSGAPQIEIRCDEPVVVLEVGSFDGGYLSLAIDLPAPMSDGLAPGDTLALTCDVEVTGANRLPEGVVVRLNLDTGGAPLQMEQTSRMTAGPLHAVFDVSEFGETIPDTRAAWIDIVLTGVTNSAIALRDCRISRLPKVPL